MDVYTYSFDCPGWFGRHRGTRNVYMDPESTMEPLAAARQDARQRSGAGACDVHILQKFRLVVEHVETYPAMATTPLHKLK